MTAAWNHLSEEALNDVLIDQGSPESEAHLAVCADCRAKVGEFHSDLSLFNMASMAWSEVSSARPQRLHAVSRVHMAFVSWAAVGVLMLVTAVTVGYRIAHPHVNRANAIPAVDTQSQIAQDNELLQAVNAAINPDEASPIDEYRMSVKTHPHIKAHAKKRLK